jgi:hypothetical protein
MKKFKKSDFYFLDNNGFIIEPVESQLYYNYEIRFILKFPFILKQFIEYKLIGDYWIETGKKL